MIKNFNEIKSKEGKLESQNAFTEARYNNLLLQILQIILDNDSIKDKTTYSNITIGDYNFDESKYPEIKEIEIKRYIHAFKP